MAPRGQVDGVIGLPEGVQDGHLTRTEHPYDFFPPKSSSYLSICYNAPSSWFPQMRCTVLSSKAASIWFPFAKSWRASVYFFIPVTAPIGIAIVTRIPATSTVMIARRIAGPKMHLYPPKIFLNSFHTGIQPQKRHQERAKANGITRMIALPA